MADAWCDEERLPWLQPLPVPARKRSGPSAGRRAQAPLFAVMTLFLLAGVGMISYLVGRGSVPPAAIEPPIVSLSRPAPEATVTLPPVPAPSSPAARDVRLAEAPPAAAETPTRRATPRPTARVTRASRERRPVRTASAPPRRAAPVRSSISPVPRYVIASNVVQLGIYSNRSGAIAAYRRLVRVYPYLAKLPRTIRRTPAQTGSPRYYRLRTQAYSPDHARLLCDRLRSIGRGCTVLPQGR